ncbi:hypothetical protein [Pontibacter sp. G13]|uniref:hypothetical protein n=1 Tax=Pontibacter sp. G13 TaxID=3074898 RepID=UPI00288A6D00|nr:hypothetical protein [Pontibacter sp. G13]WNJ21106.1 hypothetical protein RJD25_11610 [Pontibacter sp. G13]
MKQYLTAFHNKGRNRQLELIELLLKHPDMENGQLAKVLYKDQKAKAFIMLKKRLLERMYESLTLSVNFSYNPSYLEDPAAFESIKLYKQLEYAQVLRQKGLYDLAEEVLEKCIQQAKSSSMPEFQLKALLLRRSMSNGNNQERQTLTDEIQQTLAQYVADLKVVGKYEEYRTILSTEDPMSDILEESLRSYVNDFSNTELEDLSPRGTFFHLSLKSLHSLESGNTPQARIDLNALIHFLESHRGLQTQHRMAIPHIQLANLELTCGRFFDARQAASKALALVAPTRTNHLTAGIHELHSLIFLNRLDDAEELMLYLKALESTSLMPDKSDMLVYLCCCIWFLKGEPEQARREFLQISHLYQYKAGWNLDLRILEIMILIDCERIDQVFMKLDSMRKHVNRYGTRERPIRMFKFLQQLARTGFELDLENPSFQESLVWLQNQPEWQYYPSEVIRYDCWIQSKSEQRPLAPLQHQTLQTWFENHPVE